MEKGYDGHQISVGSFVLAELKKSTIDELFSEEFPNPSRCVSSRSPVRRFLPSAFPLPKFTPSGPDESEFERTTASSFVTSVGEIKHRLKMIATPRHDVSQSSGIEQQEEEEYIPPFHPPQKLGDVYYSSLPTAGSPRKSPNSSTFTVSSHLRHWIRGMKCHLSPTKFSSDAYYARLVGRGVNTDVLARTLFSSSCCDVSPKSRRGKLRLHESRGGIVVDKMCGSGDVTSVRKRKGVDEMKLRIWMVGDAQLLERKEVWLKVSDSLREVLTSKEFSRMVRVPYMSGFSNVRSAEIARESAEVRRHLRTARGDMNDTRRRLAKTGKGKGKQLRMTF